MQPVLFEKSVICLKGDRDRQAYENYVRVRYNREPIDGEWLTFYNNHQKAHSELIEDQYNRRYLYVLFN